MSENLVSIYRGPRPIADLLIGVIRSEGLKAMISSDDADGWAPHVGFAQGTRILVRPADADRARELIEAAPVEAPEDEAQVPEDFV